MNKVCNKCGINKDINEFSKYKVKGKEYYRSQCKKCRCDYQKEYNAKNKDEISIKNKIYREKNKNKLREHSKKFYQEHKEEIKEYKKKNEEHYKKWRKEYREKNKEHIKEYMKKYRKENKNKISKQRNKYNQKRKKEDTLFYFKIKTRQMLLNSFKRRKNKKPQHTEQILGCTIENFIKHLLQTFKDNYGYEWDEVESVHIDHIKPLKLATTEEDVIELCHYTNLQLLKAKDNLQKSCKYEVKNGNNEDISNSDNDDESDITNKGTNRPEEDDKN